MLTFKQFIESATILGKIDLPSGAYSDPSIKISQHAFDRIGERDANVEDIKSMAKKALKKVSKVGEYLFYSSKLKRAFIGIVNKIGKIIVKTVLPVKDAIDKYFAKSGTEKVVVENKEYNIIEVD